jgi:soluble lytic murein transglycosylase-like protein
MAKYSSVTINVPDIKKVYSYTSTQNFSTPSVKSGNVKLVQKINTKYGSIFSYWGGIFEIPKGILIGFCATESGGTMAPPNKFKATGLMQVTPSAIFECSNKWRSEVNSDLPIEALNLLNQKVPNIFKGSLSSVNSTLLNLLENDANFNIMSGTLVLRWLLERFSTLLTGAQFNKAIIGYNSGAYNKTISNGTKANKIPTDTTSLYDNPKLNKESRNYLLKTLGIDGFYTIIYKDKPI